MIKKLLAFFAVLALPFVPAPAVASPSAAAVPYHIVRPGETIKKIAAFYHVKPAQLRAWNGIVKPNQPAVDGVLNLAQPLAKLAGWRTWVEGVTPGQVNWDPARKCPVPPAKLRKVWVTYIDFYGASHTGSIIVNQAIAAQTQRVFLTLYRMRFRIQGMSPMALNAPYLTDMGTVTAGYNCRTVAGSKTLSQHAYGMAIDINPVQNPMIRGPYIDPVDPSSFLARAPYRRGMVHAAGAVRAFTANGFYWGGRWRSLKDYMHFSPSNK
nr:M15 family metallopeptidase [Actinoplanes sp. N902-109]